MIKITKDNIKEGYDDKDFDEAFKWPNEKLLLIRLGVCVLIGAVIALVVISCSVMLINKILETHGTH